MNLLQKILKYKTAFCMAFAMAMCVQANAGDTERKAVWISVERAQGTPNSWVMFRTTFDTDTVPDKLMADISADTKYWMWINGEPAVFEGGLKRGPAPNAIYFDRVDIAPYLQKGENTIAILVWHFGKNGFAHVNSGSTGLFFEALSPALEIVSDNNWLCSVYDAYGDTEAPYPNFRLAESNIRFDARKERAGWNKPGYEGKMSRAINIADASNSPFGKLVERPIPQWKDYGLKDYVSITTSAKGDTVFCRLPYNCQVTPYLKVKAPAGKTIQMLTDNYNGGSDLNVRAEYITRDGEQEYESYGWMNGHQMLYIIPEGVEVVDLKFRETGYNADFSGGFECDDEFLNELWKRSARTLYVTMRDNYMDCPDRERAQWWGDEVNELGETFYALSPDAQKLATKGIHELMNWQRNSGEIYSPVPGGNWHKELPLQMLASVGHYGFYTQYFYSGDSSWVADIYEPLHKYLHEVWNVEDNGHVTNRAGDWSWGDWGKNVDMDVLTNCWYYLALQAEKEFARMLGKDADVKENAAIMKNIKDNFDTHFRKGGVYRSAGHKGKTDDRAQAMAVVSGLASADTYPSIVAMLDTVQEASPYMEKYVLEALFVMNEPERALKRMHDRYAKMLAYKDYTTLFEGWGIGAEGFGGGTLNHAWSGGPLTLLSQKVCGIEPTSLGFATFKVTPQMGNLRNASAHVDTAYGLIDVVLKRNKNNIQAKITVPHGTKAEVNTVKGPRTLEAGKHNVKLTL